MNYATLQFKKFRDQTGEVDALDEKKCAILRKQAREDLEVVKGKYIDGMVQTQQTADGKSTSPDGVATNQNKFFFDIIKWGSALLL